MGSMGYGFYCITRYNYGGQFYPLIDINTKINSRKSQSQRRRWKRRRNEK